MSKWQVVNAASWNVRCTWVYLYPTLHLDYLFFIVWQTNNFCCWFFVSLYINLCSCLFFYNNLHNINSHCWNEQSWRRKNNRPLSLKLMYFNLFDWFCQAFYPVHVIHIIFWIGTKKTIQPLNIQNFWFS